MTNVLILDLTAINNIAKCIKRNIKCYVKIRKFSRIFRLKDPG